MDRPRRRAAPCGPSAGHAARPACRTPRAALALCAWLLALSSCGMLPGVDSPSPPEPTTTTPTPTEDDPTVGRIVVDVPVAYSSGVASPGFGADLPRAFGSGAEYDEWRVDVARERVELDGGVLEAEFGPLEVDDSAEVVVAAVYDSCDAAHRFVSTEPSAIVSETYDATPEDEYLCERPWPRLALSIVGLEEIGAGSREDVVVR